MDLRLAEFLDECFGYEAPMHYATDFAPLFDSANQKEFFLMNLEDQILSSAILFPTTVVSGSNQFRVGVIGGVATKENYRGNGYSKQVLASLESRANELGLDALVLWSDQYSFYSKLGFEIAGQQHLYSLASLNVVNHLEETAKNILEEFPEYGWDEKQVRALYEKHPMRLERSESYWESLRKVKSCNRLQWVNTKGEVLAYLAFDRGKDLGGIIHEWGGDPRALTKLVSMALSLRGDLVWMTHPSFKDDPIVPLLSKEALIQDGHLALVKKLNPTLPTGWFNNVWFWGLDSL